MYSNPTQNTNPSKLPADRMVYAQSTTKILEALHTPVPERLLATRKQAGKEITYLPWHNACRMLDFKAPGWSGMVIEVKEMAGLVVVIYQITIQTAEGSISRQATGQESLDSKTFGDAVCNAEAQAFKRAAAKFGLGLDLYDKE